MAEYPTSSSTMNTTFGAPSGARGGSNGPQSGSESRTSILTVPLNESLILSSTRQRRNGRSARHRSLPRKHLLQPWVKTYAHFRPKSTLNHGFTRRLRSNSRVDINQPMTYSADEACDVGAAHRLAVLTGLGLLQLRPVCGNGDSALRFRAQPLLRWVLSRRRRRAVDHLLPERIRPATRDQAPHADS